MHVRAGFRAVLRRPALALGEIAWRWAFGAAAWTLVILAIERILARVDITEPELLIARHSDLFQIADACARILYQVLPQLARECAVLAPAIAVLWIAAATVGRAITLNALLLSDNHIRQGQTHLQTSVIPSEDAPSNQRAQVGAPESRDLHFGSLLALHFLRALFAFAAILAFFGALFLAGMAMSAQSLTLAASLAILLAALVAFFWSVVNWFLALSPIWIVRDSRPALKSIADSVNLYRRNPGPYTGIAVWFGIFRAVALAAAFLAALVAAQASAAAAIALCVVIALVYFATADFLYIARLAAFVALDESRQPSAFSVQPPAPEPAAI